MNSYLLLAKFVHVLSALVSLIGLILMTFGFYLAYFSFSTASWPTTKAEIIESRVVQVPAKNGTNYKVQIKYRYNINGVEYTGDSVRFINYGYDDEQEAKQIADKFPVGSKVDLKFQGSNPKMTVLEPGLHVSDWLAASAGFALIVVAFILRFTRKKWLLQHSS